jgi:hypothetical protein
MTHFVVDHGIWSNVRMWKECIDLNIKRKMSESTERMKARNKQKEENTKKNERESSSVRDKVKAGKSLFGKTFGKIKKAIQSKEEKFSDEVTKHTNLIFNELSKYVQYLCNFGVKFEQANNLLLYLCNYYQMDKSKMHILLTELLSNQKNTQNMFTDKEMLVWQLMKRGNRF